MSVGVVRERRIGVMHGGCVGIHRRADGFEVSSEGFVHGGVLHGVKPGSEGRAVAAADGLAAEVGDDVGGVEVLGGKGGEQKAGVVRQPRDVG
ncbi:hypothetical protein U1Q18_011275 [Sarracenia purpurea var. burkii]